METKQVVSIRLYPSTIAEIKKCGYIKQEFIEAAIKEKLSRESRVEFKHVSPTQEMIEDDAPFIEGAKKMIEREIHESLS